MDGWMDGRVLVASSFVFFSSVSIFDGDNEVVLFAMCSMFAAGLLCCKQLQALAFLHTGLLYLVLPS
jgi:hypothetical protein